jgi:hypothetical protein
MNTDTEIVNRVANSSLITLDLEALYPEGARLGFDLEPFLYQGLVLREKDFREAIAAFDWEQYRNANVYVYCSADAIVPTWAYMLVSLKLTTVAQFVVNGSAEVLEIVLFRKVIQELDLSQYEDKKIVVKGCSKLPVPTDTYMEITRLLAPIVQSLMFGEPCSNVPLYKKPLKRT